jgi:hypothetical protein
MAPKPAAAVVFTSLLACIFIIMLAMLAIWALKPPASVAASAPPTDFSAERALANVRMIARAPHPIGSDANTAVREYLLEQLSAIGFQPQVFSAIGIYHRRRGITAGKVQDIVAQLPGTASSRGILLIAHYDSVTQAPGAADDAAGVAALLETLRAIKAGPALKNDVSILMTDGEEAGTLGAEAFVHSHPLMKDVGLMMNFEARGSHGPSLLFETSTNNRALIENVSSAAPYPTGSSLFYALYKLLPNDTDFTVFRPSKIPALNFAFGSGLEAYHTRLDVPGNLSAASLQHHGSYALALTRHFGAMDLHQLQNSTGDSIFFDWFGSSLITYRESLAIAGEALATLLLACAVLFALRNSELSIRKLLLALLGCIAILLAVSAVLAFAGWIGARLLAGNLIVSDSQANAYLLTGYVLLGFCAGGLVLVALQKKFSVRELSLGGLMILDILSWGLALKLPAGSYLLFGPLLLMVLGVLALEFAGKAERPIAQTLAGLPGTVLTVLLFAPFIYLIYIFLTLQLPTLLVAGVLLGIFFITCVPLISVAVPRNNWKPALSLLLLSAVICLVMGATLSHNSAEHPRRDSILYGLNVDDHAAKWISYDQAPDTWTTQFFTNAMPQRQPLLNYLAGVESPLISAPAPLLELLPPTAEIKADERAGDVHKLQLVVKSQRNAGSLSLAFANDTQVSSVTIEGREVATPGTTGGFSIRLVGMGNTDIHLQVTLQSPSGVSFWLMDQAPGLPLEVHPRPDNIIADYGSDLTAVCRKYRL